MLTACLALDTTYGDGGHVVTDLKDPGISDDYATAAAVHADGKLVVVGDTQDPNDPLPNDSSLCLVRYNPEGARDPSFGHNGVAVYHAGDTRGIRVAIQSDGKS